jgi:hypothetical protein
MHVLFFRQIYLALDANRAGFSLQQQALCLMDQAPLTIHLMHTACGSLLLLAPRKSL